MPDLPFLQYPGLRHGAHRQKVAIHLADGQPRAVDMQTFSKYISDNVAPSVPWGRVIPTAATVTGTGANATAQSQLLSQLIAGNAFQTLANAATAVYQFDKPATVTDTLVAFEFSAGNPTQWAVTLDKYNGSTWDTIVTWSSWIIENGVGIAGKADVIVLPKGTHDAAGTYRLNVTNNTGGSQSVRTPHLYRMPSSGTPPIVYVIGASIEDGDTRWVRWSAICAPLNIDVLCINLAIGGYATATITAAVKRWQATTWRPPINWAITHTLGNNITGFRPYSAQSEAYKAQVRADLNALLDTLTDVRHTYSASTTFRDYRAGTYDPAVLDGVYEENGSKPADEDINLPILRARQPYNINVDGRPYFDFYNLLLNNEDAWLGDGIHMNGSGQTGLDNWICQRWVDIYKKNRLDIVPVTNPIRQLTTDVFAFKAAPTQRAALTLTPSIWALPIGNGGQAELLAQMTTTGFPVATIRPTISGDFAVGSTLTVADGTWNNSPTFTYQWTADGVPITGATASTYVTTSAENQKFIGCRVRGTNATGYVDVDSSNTIAIVLPLAPTDIPGLMTWLDASDASTFTIATGVQQWRDKSGNGYHAEQASAGNRPTRRQSPTDNQWEVYGNGTGQQMSIPTMPIRKAQIDPVEVICLTGDNPDQTGALFSQCDPAGSNRHTYLFFWEDGSNPFLNINLGNTVTQRTKANLASAGFSPDFTKPFVYDLQAPASNVGTLAINNVYSFTMPINATDPLTGGNWGLFTRNPAPGFVGSGPIRQFIAFDRIITPLQRAALYAWLKTHGGAV